MITSFDDPENHINQCDSTEHRQWNDIVFVFCDCDSMKRLSGSLNDVPRCREEIEIVHSSLQITATRKAVDRKVMIFGVANWTNEHKMIMK